MLAAFVLLATPVGPAEAARTSEERLRDQIEEVTGRLHDAESREAVVRDRLAKIDREIKAAERELATVHERVAARARTAYVGGLGGEDTIAIMLTTPDPASVLGRLSLLEASTRSDRAVLHRASYLRRTLVTQRARAAALRKESDAVERALRGEITRLTALLRQAENARAAYAASARRRASRSSVSGPVRLNGRYACLVGPSHAYRDTWGAPRSGGRRHKGTDVFAPYGSPSYAVTSGYIRRLSYSSNGGKQVYLAGDDGNEYFYAHMASYATRTGKRVQAGELIAYVGDSGNARGGAAHVHFEVHPGGGAPVNPYPYVRRFCA